MLATPGMDRHLAYVGMTRHREGVEVYAGRDDFAPQIKNFMRQAEKERGREQGRDCERDEGLER
jgi:ATP-dependent exoDNAse (exonuclease V) alpha subunit